MNQEQLPPGYLESRPPGWLQQDISGELVATAAAFIVVEVCTTALRVVARRVKKIRFDRSDAVMIMSLVCNLGLCIGCILSTYYGVGRHIPTVSEDDRVRVIMVCNYAVASFYIFAVTLPKLAILDLYLHIFMTNLTRRMTYAVGVFLILNALINFPVLLSQCHPISAAWDRSAGWCLKTGIYYALGSLFNIITDIVMLLLPIPISLSIQAPKRVKFGIFITFLVGGLGLVTSILRFSQFFNYAIDYNYLDETWSYTHILAWTIIEPGVYHLTACIISFRPLIRLVILHIPIPSWRRSLETCSPEPNYAIKHPEMAIPVQDSERDDDLLKTPATREVDPFSATT